MDSMYEILLSLPLFNGVSYNRISEIVGSTRFHFLKYGPSERIVSAGDFCGHIRFIISGWVQLSVVSSDGRFKVEQRLSAPDVISPDYLFGRSTIYPANVDSGPEGAGILQISKNDYIEILHSDRVFLFNFLNLLSRNAQVPLDGILSVTSGSLEQRIAFWIIATTQPRSTDIVLTCRHRDLYAMFGVQRNVFMSTLDSMKERGIIDYSTNSLRVISRQALNALL